MKCEVGPLSLGTSQRLMAKPSDDLLEAASLGCLVGLKVGYQALHLGRLVFQISFAAGTTYNG